MDVSIPPRMPSKRRIKKFEPLQLGKMLAVLYGLLGILFLPFFLFGALASASLPEEQRAGMMMFSVSFALFFPVIYAAMGFIGGLIGALIYNLVAKWIGGIEVEVE